MSQDALEVILVTYWLTDYSALSLTWLTWPWWVMIPKEDFTDVSDDTSPTSPTSHIPSQRSWNSERSDILWRFACGDVWTWYSRISSLDGNAVGPVMTGAVWPPSHYWWVRCSPLPALFSTKKVWTFSDAYFFSPWFISTRQSKQCTSLRGSPWP